MTNYIIIQKRKDAIGIVQENLLVNLGFSPIHIKWFKFMPFSHLWELIRSVSIGLNLKKEDTLLSCNSKSIHTHIIPFFTKAKLVQLHYHFDNRVFGLHRLPFFSYTKLFRQWHTLFTSNNMKNIARTKYGCRKHSVIKLGVDKTLFKRKSELTKDDNQFIYVGSFGHRKNIENMIEGFAKAVNYDPEIKLLIVNGSAGSYEELLPLLNKYVVKHKISYKKDVSLAQLIELYNFSGTLLFPTLVEGFGLPLVEANLCGCKIVTSDRPVHKEVTNNQAIYVDPEDPEEIAKGIILSLETSFQENKETYTWQEVANNIKEILE